MARVVRHPPYLDQLGVPRPQERGQGRADGVANLAVARYASGDHLVARHQQPHYRLLPDGDGVESHARGEAHRGGGEHRSGGQDMLADNGVFPPRGGCDRWQSAPR